MDNRERVLRHLERDARLEPGNIADALSLPEQEVRRIIEEARADGTIVGYSTLINWDKTDRVYVSAMIEIRVHLQRGEGFDSVARSIGSFPEVQSLYLMSGGYDLMVVIEGKTMRDVALFVSEKLAVIDGVTGTATHFILNKYKDKGITFNVSECDQRVILDI